MNNTSQPPVLDAIVRFWWVRLPLVTRRISPTLTLGLLDGHYLAGYGPVARFASPLALLLGLLIGWLRLGYVVVPTEALLVMMLLAALGTLSAHLGVLCLAGFALGNFLLTARQPAHVSGALQQVFRMHLPLVIEYALLGILLVQIPLMTKALLAQPDRWRGMNRKMRLGIAMLAHAALSFVLVFLWTQTVPILIRPVFTWTGGTPTTSAMRPLQQYGYVIASAALLASVVRLFLQHRAATQAPLAARLAVIDQSVQMATPVRPLAQRLPAWFVAVGRAVWSTLLLSGMLQSWLTALFLGALILLLQAARGGLIAVPLGWWRRSVERLPMLLRLLAGGLIMLFLARRFVGQAQLGSVSFAPAILLTATSLIVFFLLTPGVARPKPPREK